MYRLLISLLGTLVLALVIFYFLLQYAPEKMLRGSLLKQTQLNFQGTAYLLNQRLKNAEDKEQELKKIQQMFGYDIQLKHIDELTLSAEEKQQLLQGNLQLQEIDKADFIVFPTDIPSTIWQIQIEQTETEEYKRLVIGTAKMLEDVFRQIPQEQWPAKTVELGKKFGFPFQLMKLKDAPLEADMRSRLMEDGLIGLNYQSDDEQYYYRMFDTPYVVKAGPIPGPLIIPYLITGIIVFLVVLLALAIFVWIKPLWKNLLFLHDAATEFGNGNFNSRVKIHSFSPVKNISRAFNDMAERIQNLILSHKDLTSAVSHELRTPLARLRFSLDMLQNAKSKKHRDHYVAEMATDIDELNNLIGELLTYARFEREKPAIIYQDCELRTWLEQQVNRIAMLDDKKKLQTRFDALTGHEIIAIEPRLMARALTNLLTNAIRHAKSAIEISVELKDGRCLFIVDDDGEGIDKSLRESIFQPFKRADVSRNRDTGGFGIGLSIVKQVAEWHNGAAYITDSSLSGSRFIIDIPVNKTTT